MAYNKLLQQKSVSQNYLNLHAFDSQAESDSGFPMSHKAQSFPNYLFSEVVPPFIPLQRLCYLLSHPEVLHQSPALNSMRQEIASVAGVVGNVKKNAGTTKRRFSLHADVQPFLCVMY
jgi:hypothetical protein